MKILVTGAKGMLGQDLVSTLAEQGYCVIPTDIDNLDITDENSVKSYLNETKPDLIIHGAAYTNVDGAESDPETAFKVNETGSENLAKVSGKNNIPIIYVSTDYVFDGTKKSPYEPEDNTNPINIYGLSKLKGEESVQKYNHNHYITRTSWLYGHKGKNFVEMMISLSQNNSELKVVNDQTGCPTWTMDLVNGILSVIKENKPYGIYHICGSGFTTWHGFASKIFELMDINIKVLPVSTEEFPRPAKRPMFSIMNNNNLCNNWEDSLKEYIARRSK